MNQHKNEKELTKLAGNASVTEMYQCLKVWVE